MSERWGDSARDRAALDRWITRDDDRPGEPDHVDGADLWECPCRECTALDWRAADVSGIDVPSLAQWRHDQWPEYWPGKAEA